MSDMRGVLAAAAVLALSGGVAGAQANRAPAKVVTLVGTVVDAACYMMHPAAADGGSHEECGRACVARGVPVAIANEADKTLYFVDGGVAALSAKLHERVSVTGTVTKKREPMELKMPVGEHNEMTVRVDGGYKVIAIQTIGEAPARRK